MHMLSAQYRSEFLATPQLIRLEYARGQNGFESTLLVKASTLLLKYIVLGARVQIAFGEIDDQLIYALKVYDDNEQGGLLWSVLENDREKEAVRALQADARCQVFLFNEIAVNVAWTELTIQFDPNLLTMLSAAKTGTADHSKIKGDASRLLDRMHEGDAGDDLIILELHNQSKWNYITNHYVTNSLSKSLIDLSNKDEGNQQEQICLWLTDNLTPAGAHYSPQIPKGKEFRELTDFLLSHQFGSILIESKSLSILSRTSLPNRAKLKRDVASHIEKAVKQLRGGMRRLKEGVVVTDIAGEEIEVERTNPMHGIILIPDLDLIEDRSVYGSNFIKDFLEHTGGFVHLLDISELLRIVQAAEAITARSKIATPMMAFDYYLMERFKKAVEAGTICIEVLLRFVAE